MDETSTYYACEDCGIVRHISELTHGCPICGETMVPAEPQPMSTIGGALGAAIAGYRDKDTKRCAAGLAAAVEAVRANEDKLVIAKEGLLEIALVWDGYAPADVARRTLANIEQLKAGQ